MKQSNSQNKQMEKKIETQNLIFNKRFQVKKRISSGSFGVVFACQDLNTKEYVALKIEKKETSKFMSLQKEIQLLTHLQGLSVIPKLYWHGEEHNFNCLAQQLLGRDLSYYLKHYKKFSLKCVVNIALQLLSALEQIHERGIIHRDIKPENILTGKDNLSNQLYLVDFGISKCFRDSKHNHIPFLEQKPFIGTTRYASIASHNGHEQSRKDDLESLGYVLIFLIKGNLTWQNIPANTDKEKTKLVGSLKQQMTHAEICNHLPSEFQRYFDYVKKIQFKQTPDYKYLHSLFNKIAEKQGFANDKKFDWSESGTTSTKSSDASNQNQRLSYSKIDKSRGVIRNQSHDKHDSLVTNELVPKIKDGKPQSQFDSQYSLGLNSQQSSVFNNYAPSMVSFNNQPQGLNKKRSKKQLSKLYVEDKQDEQVVNSHRRMEGEGELFKQQSNFQDLENINLQQKQERRKSQKKKKEQKDLFNDFDVEVEDEDNELSKKFANLKKQNLNKQVKTFQRTFSKAMNAPT